MQRSLYNFGSISNIETDLCVSINMQVNDYVYYYSIVKLQFIAYICELYLDFFCFLKWIA